MEKDEKLQHLPDWKKSDDDTSKTEITQAQVCNPIDIKDVDFGTPDGEHAYLQFVELAPIGVSQ